MDRPAMPPITLETFAAVSVRLRTTPEQALAVVLRDHRLDAATWDRAKAYWTRELERDAEEGDGDLLVQWAEACEAVRTTAPEPAPEPAPEAAPPSAPAPVSVEKPSFLIAKEAPATPAASPWAKPVMPAAVLRSPPGPAPPPFPGPAAPPAVVDLAPGPAPSTATPGPAIAPPKPVHAFVAAPPPPVVVAPPAPLAAPPPPVVVAPPAPAAPAPELAFERYAALAAEIAVFPDRAAKACAKVGLADEASFRAVEAHWRARFEEDAALKETWDGLFKKYCTWLTQKAEAAKHKP